jgi:ApbE superfamily uncharacterized protein (UPF0280 family)
MSEFVLAKIEVEETAATVAAGREFIGPAAKSIKSTRMHIERQIRKDPFFLTTLEPYDPEPGSPRPIFRMCEAAKAAGVGPMAAVAGVVAQEAMEAMAESGCVHGWVDNGGDISLLAQEPVTVEVFTEPGSSRAVALEVDPSPSITAICTSSGRLGHSISFGDSDASVVIAKDAVLADALATAIGNRVKDTRSIKSCFDDFKDLPGFVAGLVLRDGDATMFGKVPKIVEVEHNPERITAHSSMSSSKFTGAQRRTTEVGT